MDRVQCVVPFCGRTRPPNEWNEWLCQKHYMLVDNQIKRVRRRLKRKAFRLGWQDFLKRLDLFLWNKAKHQAIERSAGITK